MENNLQYLEKEMIFYEEQSAALISGMIVMGIQTRMLINISAWCAKKRGSDGRLSNKQWRSRGFQACTETLPLLPGTSGCGTFSMND